MGGNGQGKGRQKRACGAGLQRPRGILGSRLRVARKISAGTGGGGRGGGGGDIQLDSLPNLGKEGGSRVQQSSEAHLNGGRQGGGRMQDVRGGGLSRKRLTTVGGNYIGCKNSDAA